MLHKLEQMAELSVGRGCGFAAIGIGTAMVGCYGNMPLATKVGGVLTLIVSLVLLVRGLAARRVPYKRTELWLLLEPADRPRSDVAQQLIGTILRDTYLRFALHAGVASLALLVTSVVLTTLTRW